MKTLMVGLGRQGARILELLVEKGFDSISLCDARKETLDSLKQKYGNKVEIVTQNIFKMEESERISFLKGFDFVLDALPSFLSFKLLNSACTAGSKVVSVSFLEEDFMKLDPLAKKGQALIVPDCGVAPGFSHLLAGYSVNKLEGATRVIMKLGAIPLKPVSPFFHNLTWSVQDLMEEYVRPAKIRCEGKMKSVDPFDDIEEEKVMGIKLQSFITDGARSFLTNFPEVADMEERTLRHHGHLDYMKKLREAGPLDAKKVEEEFGSLSLEDMFVMEIVAENSQRGVTKTINHQYLMKFDNQSGVPALVNSVAITAAETLNLIREGKIKETGVKPLELLATRQVYETLVAAHQNLGAEVTFKEF